MKIAHVYQESGIRFGEPQAAQLHIYHTISGLQQAGHTVTLLALQGRQVLCTDDLGVFGVASPSASHYGRLGFTGTTLFKGFESAIRRVQSICRLPYLALFDSVRMLDASRTNLSGYDLIHERFNLLSVGGAWASQWLGIPLVLEVNADLLEQRKFKGVPERGLRRLFAIWATQKCFDAAAKIICISTGLKAHLHTQWKIEECKLTVLPCAADIDAFGRNDRAEAVRRELGLTTELVVMWVGGFFPWHDLDLLLESFAQVVDKRPNTKLVLVGDGQTRAAVARKISENRLGDAVIMTGAIAHSRVPEMVSIADVAVVPAAPVSASGGGTGTPLKLFEYMAAGKAIVATELNQASEVVEEGQTGLLVKAGDVAGFSQAILALLDSPAERARLGQNARRQAVAKYSWTEYTQRLEEVYQNLLEHAQSRSPSTSLN